ncbi:hypothetical protein CJF31_00011825 [Rutstroemia sp. NJR-2017a BVV2]|nr:hypothetical protein CJF31_00011825 [Rutstroemia sp. NJR-2017a BVV2]
MASHRSYKTSPYHRANGTATTSPHRRHSNARASPTSSDEDALIATLKALTINPKGKENIKHSRSSSRSSSVASPCCDTTGMLRFMQAFAVYPRAYPAATYAAKLDPMLTRNWDSSGTSTLALPFDIPGRKKSAPIAITIDKPARGRTYTPLTGRGELRGGYFPDHEESLQIVNKPLIPSSKILSQKIPVEQTVTMSSPFSPIDSPSSDTSVHGPASIITSPFAMPETLIIPKGKYYPSNYKPSPTSPNPAAMLNASLQLPPKSQRQKPTNPHHQRRTSDIKRKLQKYQRDMIEQARLASGNSSPGVPSASGTKPISPRLLPLGSPGPITPFELEESAGYLIAGQRGNRGNLIGDGAREQEAVERMIRAEEERRRREGQSSPAARV